MHKFTNNYVISLISVQDGPNYNNITIDMVVLKIFNKNTNIFEYMCIQIYYIFKPIKNNRKLINNIK